jgi:cell division protein FtsB
MEPDLAFVDDIKGWLDIAHRFSSLTRRLAQLAEEMKQLSQQIQDMEEA